jgi:serine/threonine protein kinase
MKSSSINNLHVVKTLNKGAFAEVYQAIEISSGKPVALKVVRETYDLLNLCSKNWIQCLQMRYS